MNAFQVLSTVLLVSSGCLGPAADPSGSPTATTTTLDRSHVLPLIQVDGVTSYGIVREWRETTTLVAYENEAASRPREQELYFRIIDAEGMFHDQVFKLPERQPGSEYEVTVSLPRAPTPFLMTAQCGCIAVSLKNHKLDPAFIQGNRSFVEELDRTIRVSYNPDDPQDVGHPLTDRETINFNSSVVHYMYVSGANLDGHVTLTTPSGRELARWEYQGRSAVGGHTSNGSRPLEIGNWSLDLTGVGWFDLRLWTYAVRPDAWGALGVKPPGG